MFMKKIICLIMTACLITMTLCACTGNTDGTNTPGTNAPGTNTPGTNTPGTNTPGTNSPTTDATSGNIPGTGESPAMP